jgi:hypothetical protein
MESDNFSVTPDDVRGQSSDQYYYPNRGQQYANAGMSPLTELEPLFQRRSAGGGGGQQAGLTNMAQSGSLYRADADFYANEMGDIGGAAALTQSKEGKSVFKMFEPHDFDMGEDGGQTQMQIVPKGEKMIPTRDGNKRMPIWMLAANRTVNGRKMPVMSVPFKGGDDEAEKYRELLGASKGLLTNLSELEKLYAKHSVLSGILPTQASAEAKALEGRIMLDYSRVMTGAKGMGAGVSDHDMEIMESMTPHRASRVFSRLGGNEMALLKRTRQQVLDKLRAAGQANGIDLISSNGGMQKSLASRSLDAKSKEIE